MKKESEELKASNITTPSVINASTADMEAAIGQTLAKLTGWENCEVRIGTMDFVEAPSSSGATVRLTLSATFSPK